MKKKIPELKKDSKRGGEIAGDARTNLEKELGRSIISKENYLKGGDAVKKITPK